MRDAQNFKEFYSKHISSYFSAFLSTACVGTRIKPNHLTIAMIPLGLLGAICLATQGLLGMLVGPLFFILLNIFDAADGELARFTQQTSTFGAYLDKVAHYVTDVAFVVAWGIAIGGMLPGSGPFIACVVGAMAVVGDSCARDLLPLKDQSSASEDEALKRKSLLAFEQNTIFFAVKNISSNVASWHLLPVLAVVAMVTKSVAPVIVYFYFFVVVHLIKFALRMVRIYGLS